MVLSNNILNNFSKYCELFPELGSFHLYSPQNIKFLKNIHSNALLDNSFVINDKDEGLICLIFAEESKISYFDNPLRIFTPKVHINPIHVKSLLKKLYRLQENNNISTFDAFIQDDLLSYFFDKVLATETITNAIVDLSLSEEKIFSELRKSYKSLTNWGKRELSVIVEDKINSNQESFTEFSNFYEEVAGGTTELWDKQFELLMDGGSFILKAYLQDKLVAANIIQLGKDSAYYALGAYNRLEMNKKTPLSHWPLMASILHAKNIGKKKFDLGYIGSNNQNIKEQNIFKFKKGFASYLTTENKFTLNLLPDN